MNAILGSRVTLISAACICALNLVQIGQEMARYTCLCISNMAAIAILNFTKTKILDKSQASGANVYLRTKFYANVCIGGRDMARNPNPVWRRLPS